ncbi:MAG: ATP synthase F0 subunit B [Terracidiphilus sp.]
MPQTRPTAKILRIFFLAGLLTTACAPVRLSAQDAAQASAAQTPAANEAAKPVTQEEQNNVFRLEGPLVKWTAKTLNTSTETAATIFEFINFGVIVLLIGVPLYKALPKVLRARGEKVRNDLEAARKATAVANARLSAIEAKLAGLDGEIAQIRAQVEEESRQDEARIKSTIGEESARIVAAAEQEIESTAAQARRGLRHFAADLAIEQAVQQLKFTPETDHALIAEFLGDAALAAKGGQK